MNSEYIHNALNYLDDDLIAETDALRQGQKVLRTRPPVRKVIAWVAPAACLTLVLGLGSRLLPVMEAGDTAPSPGNQSQAPGQWVQDSMHNGVDESKMEVIQIWQTVRCGDLSLEIPENWTYELVSGDGGSYFIRFRPPQEAGSVQVGCWPGFGVCGTGLREEKALVAGMEATVGYYDGGKQWSFIVFRAGNKKYVVTKDGADSWWGIHGDTVMQILETLVIAGGG